MRPRFTHTLLISLVVDTISFLFHPYPAPQHGHIIALIANVKHRTFHLLTRLPAFAAGIYPTYFLFSSLILFMPK